MERNFNRVTQEYLFSILEYNPNTGVFKWRIRLEDNAWSAKYAGKIAGYKRPDGYIRIMINNKPHFAHTLAFIMHHGKDPYFIDHKNGVKHDNRIINLRDSSHAENMRNRKLDKRNTVGQMGVSFHKKSQKWMARIMKDKRAIHLGLFANIDDAIKARKDAEASLGFPVTHGRKIENRIKEGGKKY